MNIHAVECNVWIFHPTSHTKATASVNELREVVLWVVPVRVFVHSTDNHSYRLRNFVQYLQILQLPHSGS